MRKMLPLSFIININPFVNNHMSYDIYHNDIFSLLGNSKYIVTSRIEQCYIIVILSCKVVATCLKIYKAVDTCSSFYVKHALILIIFDETVQDHINSF